MNWLASILPWGGGRGRLTLVNSVLDALPTYMLSLFPIPAGVTKRLDSIRRKFLWQGNKENRGFHLVKWKSVTTGKKNGGLGIKNVKMHSKALRMKWLWKYANGNQTLWTKVIGTKHEEEDCWMTKAVTTPYGTSLWRWIRTLWEEVKLKTIRKVGNGVKIKFWKDEWHEKGNLEILFPDAYNLAQFQQKTIAKLWTSQGWNFYFRRQLNDWEIRRVADFLNTVDNFTGLHTNEDRLWWKGYNRGDFKVQSAYRMMDQPRQEQGNCLWKQTWRCKIPLDVSYVGKL